MPNDPRADDHAVRALANRFRAAAVRWALDAEDAALMLRVDRPVAARLVGADGGWPTLGAEAEHRMRLAVEIDAAMLRAFEAEFPALVWLRLGARPSRLERMFGALPEIRSVRREAEDLAA